MASINTNTYKGNTEKSMNVTRLPPCRRGCSRLLYPTNAVYYGAHPRPAAPKNQTALQMPVKTLLLLHTKRERSKDLLRKLASILNQ